MQAEGISSPHFQQSRQMPHSGIQSCLSFAFQKPELFPQVPLVITTDSFRLLLAPLAQDLRFPRWFRVWVKLLPIENLLPSPPQGRQMDYTHKRDEKTENRERSNDLAQNQSRKENSCSELPFLWLNPISWGQFSKPHEDLNLYCRIAVFLRGFLGRLYINLLHEDFFFQNSTFCFSLI